MLVQLQIWTEEESPDRILSLSDRLARISAWLEEEQGWGEKEVVLSEKPSDLLPSADLTFLSGKMLRESSPQTMAQTFGRLSKPLPTLGVIDLNGNLLNTAWVLPQNRERIYLIGHLAESRRGFRRVFPFRDSNGLFAESERETGGRSSELCSTITSNLKRGVHGQGETYVCVAQRGREEKCLTPKRTEYGKEIRKQYEKGEIQEKRKNIQQFEPREDGITNTLTGVQKDNMIMVGDFRADEGLRIREDNNCPTINARARTDGCGQPIIVTHYGHKDEVPVESNLSPTLKANSHGHEPMVKRTDSDGNARPQGYRVYETEGHSPALSAQQGGLAGGSQLINTSSVRRLTEIECERLQGFPDNWTEYGDYDSVVKKVAKTQRYKCLGNAVTVAIVKEVGLRLKEI